MARKKLTIFRRFEGKSEVDFQEYFIVMSDHLADKKATFDNVIYESNIKDVSCLFCPYPVSKENERDSMRVMSKRSGTGWPLVRAG